MNRSDCFSLNCSQGLFMMRMIIVMMNDENDEDDHYVEDKDKPARLLLSQLQPRLGVMIMKMRLKRGLECGWGL